MESADPAEINPLVGDDTVLSITLMARHRQADITDAIWLRAYEKQHYSDTTVHGEEWRDGRDITRIGAGRIGAAIPL